jgi:hypothetical protein
MPEVGFARGEERVLTGIPAKEVRRAGVRGVVIARFPDLVEEEKAGVIDAAVEIVLEAASFFARGSEEGAEFGFEEKMLAVFGAQDDD